MKLMRDPLQNHYKISLNGTLGEIVDLASELHKAAQQLGFSAQTESQLNLILEELYTNSVHYGFSPAVSAVAKTSAIPKVTIALELQALQLQITYRDNGVAFNPLNADAPDLCLSLDERPIGGLGIFFVKTLTDHVEYSHDGEFNQISMRKNLAAPSLED
jgi:serine/threonine-protein kinase RsbW